MSSNDKSVKNRRRKKLIRLDLQLKVVFITLFVASLVLLINFQLNLAGLWSIAGYTTSNEGEAMLQALRRATIQKFLLSVGMAVPLAASVGVLYSFKFCGPIFRFKEYFLQIKGGRWAQKCGLRDGDDLQDVCVVINEAVDALRSRIHKDHAFYLEVKHFLESHSAPASSAASLQVTRLRAAIAQAEEEYAQRFFTKSPAQPAPASEPTSEQSSEPQSAPVSADEGVRAEAEQRDEVPQV